MTATTISDWLDAKLAELDWNDADLARASGVYSGTISNIRKRNKIGPDSARKFAEAFKMTQADLFFQLGLQDEKPGDVIIHDPVLADIWRMIERMSEQERIAARLFLEKFFGDKADTDEKAGGTEADTSHHHGRGKSANRKATEKSKS